METNEAGSGPGLGGFLSKILGAGVKETVDSIGNAIDKIDKSDEKLELQLKFKELIVTVAGALIGYQSKLLEGQTKIIESEAKGASWLQRNWRPMLMCMCMFIIFSNYVLVPFFHITPPVLDDHIWDLMQMGVGGYVVGRSVEKITENLGSVLYNVKKGGPK